MSDSVVYATRDSTDYDDLCAVFRRRSIPAPRVVTRARSVDEAQDAVRHAASEGLRVAAFATGHAAGRLGRLDDALLLRTSIDAPVVVDPDARTARVAAGTTWGQVIAATAPHRLMGLHGSSPLVGVVGYLINGGLGFVGRLHGVAANSVLRFQVVGAGGDVRWVDSDHEPELFWALRGGGAGFGVVTAAEFRLFPAAAAYTGIRFWAAEHAAAVLRGWRDWAAHAPSAITTTIRIMNLPPHPSRPPQLARGPVVCIDGAVIAERDEDVPAAKATGDELLDRFASLGDPLHDTWHVGPPSDVAHIHLDPTEPGHGWNGHDLMRGLPDAAIDSLVALGTSRPSLQAVELRQLGGAFTTPPQPGGVLDRMPEPLLLQVVAQIPGPERMESVRRLHEGLRAELGPLLTGRCVPCLLDAASDRRPSGDAAALARLDRIRAGVDPEGRFTVVA